MMEQIQVIGDLSQEGLVVPAVPSPLFSPWLTLPVLWDSFWSRGLFSALPEVAGMPLSQHTLRWDGFFFSLR